MKNLTVLQQKILLIETPGLLVVSPDQAGKESLQEDSLVVLNKRDGVKEKNSTPEREFRKI